MFERVDVSGDDLGSCADGLHDSVRETRLVAARRMARVVHWADLHAPAPGKTGVTVGGEGTPRVRPFAATELGCLLQTTTHSARLLLADALDLRHRHPRCWAAVMTGQVEDYKARHVARAARAAGLTEAQARHVDDDCVAALTGLPWGRAVEVVAAAVIAADPAGHERRRADAEHERYVSTSRRETTTGLRTLITRTTAGDIARLDAMVAHLAEVLRRHGDTDELQVRRAKAITILADPAHACVLLARAEDDDTAAPPLTVDAAGELGRLLLAQGATALARLRPRTVLYLHLSEEALRTRAGVARVEGIGPVALSDLHQLLGRDTVVVKPVIDPTGQVPVDAYEIPRAMREALTLTRPYEIFPWGTLASRSADLDHTTPYRPPDDGGPPSQTRPANLGPLARGHHNAKTHGGFTLHQPTPGTYLWRTPTGYRYRVDHTGTHPLGRATPALVHSHLEIRLAGLLAA